ncbi:MAG: beta-phosphoglucomutase family hydrolase [Prevotellaceae bacterium]|jgi:beta-phosphoglucomutase family hydrolase|nr:beta-phosphoglucomutase family hydrolase [Prevotellaceae bacterium]
MNLSNFGVIFDMDGTIINNMPYHMRAFRVFNERHSIKMGDEEFLKKTSGKTNDDIMRLLFGSSISAEEIAALSSEKESLYRELYRSHIELSRGLDVLFGQLQARDIPMCVGSSAPDENIDLVLDGLNIRKYFKAVINASQVKKGKPNPEVFLKAAAAMHLAPAQCVVVEDAVIGVEAAHNAGMKVIAVAQIMSHEALSSADLVVDDFTGVSVETFERLLLLSHGM